MRFTKMEGLGNDYVYINGFTEHIPQEKKAEIVRKISDRHFGIGSDGAIFINPAAEADLWNCRVLRRRIGWLWNTYEEISERTGGWVVLFSVMDFTWMVKW